MMSADPFGSSNPFGSPSAPAVGGSSPAAHVDPNAAGDAVGGSPQPQGGLNFEEDDPFGIAVAPAPVVVEDSQLLCAPSVGQTISMGAENPSFVASPSHVLDSPERDPKMKDSLVTRVESSPRAEKQAPEPPGSPSEKILKGLREWQAHSNDRHSKWMAQSIADRKAGAIRYGAKVGMKADGAVASRAVDNEGMVKLCASLRLSPNGMRFPDVTRIETTSATKSPGVGMEFPFWKYCFTVYTLLPEYANQPRYDKQEMHDYGQHGSIWSVQFKRRYTDFEWLRKMLVLENPNVVVPPIPEKSFQGIKEKFGGDADDGFEGRDLGNSGSARTEWQDDKDVTNCNKCKAKFGFTVRKHHCRRCMMIYCNNCCPKMNGGKRFCADCNTLTGLTEMLLKNPEVAFRMKGFQLFLNNCFAGPLALSKTLRFFIEAPNGVFHEGKGAIEKRLMLSHPLPSVVTGGFFSNLFGGKNGDETPPAMYPEQGQRAAALLKLRDALVVMRDDHTEQLFEGLRRKKGSTPELNKKHKNDQDIAGIHLACKSLDEAMAEFSNMNKEMLFEAVALENFTAGCINAMVKLIASTHSISKIKTKSENVQNFLADINDDIAREDKALQHVIARNFKQITTMMWRIEEHRDSIDFDWMPLAKKVDTMKDPKF